MAIPDGRGMRWMAEQSSAAQQVRKVIDTGSMGEVEIGSWMAPLQFRRSGHRVKSVARYLS